jgi:hypothetical protein
MLSELTLSPPIEFFRNNGNYAEKLESFKICFQILISDMKNVIYAMYNEMGLRQQV